MCQIEKLTRISLFSALILDKIKISVMVKIIGFCFIKFTTL